MDNSFTTVYQHAPLDRADSIRLLELLPDEFGQPLKSLIHQQPHGHGVHYEALSYTWDGPVFPQQMMIGVDLSSPCISITQNLYNALQHLRFERASRMLWIDAICINQSDTKEKGHQVAHMGKLYSGAESVTAWLGLTRNENIVSILESVMAYRHELEAGKANGCRAAIDVFWLLARLQAGRLFDSAWFSRVWTVQEFVLGRHIWFQLGPYRFEERIMGSALEVISMALSRYSWTGRPPLSWDMVILNSINDLFRVREQHRSSVLSVQRLRSPPLSLAICVSSLARRRSCSNKLDRIYGMLAIANDLSIEPDYDLPLQDLLSNVARRSLQQGDFTLLHEHSMDDYKSDTLFPLSALETADGNHFPIRRPSNTTQYQASIGLPVQVHVDTAGEVRGEGLLLDQISQHTSVCTLDRTINTEDWMIQHFRTIVHRLYQEYRQIDDLNAFESGITCGASSFCCPPYANEKLFSVVSRTLTADNSSVDSSHLDSHSVGLIWKYIAIEIEAAYRSIFRTQKGYCGLGSHHLLTGDKVVLFDGATTPFILREETNAEEQWTGRYKLVSDCYLHGWMYGDYFGHKIVDEDGKIVREPPLSSPEVNNGSTDKVLRKQQFVIC